MENESFRKRTVLADLELKSQFYIIFSLHVQIFQKI